MDPTTSGSCSLPPIAVKSEPQDSQLSQNYPDDNTAGISRAQSLPNPPAVVKAEPIEPTRPTNSQPSTLQSQFVIPPPPALSIKPEPQSEPLNGTQQTHEVASSTVSPVAPGEPTIKIDYTPENALAEGRQMAAEVEAHLVGIDLSTDLRKEVWLREVASCKNFALPQTMIAVRGATGAGKSSLLNAILDDNIVPTSGMQACTAVVTEIRHHETSNIRAEVEFLSRAEWESELEILRDDLVDESGKPKRVADLRSDAGIAWHKIHAVYPHLRVEQILAMTPQQIIGEDLDIANKFDTTADIDRPNSEEFGVAIAPYIDSKDSKRTRRGRSKKRENAPPKAPALWPLIRIVRVWCKSNAISCGAVLVDLPGTADTNLARSNIAKDYMKKCQCIWIVAPITRAVDDKVAKDLLGEAFKTQLMMDGNYQAGNVTFIATKTDDISCNEVLGALGLWREPEFIDIKMRGKAADHEMEERQSAVAAKADEIAENIHQAKILKDMHTEYKEHLKALRAHQPFKPYLTAPGYQAPQRSPPKKRKRPSGNRKASGKRARIDSEDIHPSDAEHDDMGGPMDIDNGDALFEDPEEFDELDDDMVPGTEDEDEEEQVQEKRRQGPPEHEVIVISDSDEEIVVISSSDGPEAPKSAPVAAPITPSGPATQASLKQLIAKTFDEMKAMQERKKQLGKELAEAKIWADEPNKLKAKLQMETNAFCSTRRNEYSKDVLKEDFRQGLKQIDQAEAEAKNPETFDPATELRDYSTINLPVFTCSSRDYIRIQSQVKGDGGPSCFTKIEDTEIPALQEWCHKLTTHARERAARALLEQLSTLLEAVLSYVNEVQGANMADRLMLAEAWESSAQQSSIDKGNDLGLTTAKPSTPLEPATPVKPSRVRRKTMTLPPSPPASQKLTAMAQRARDLLEQERYASQQANKSVSFRLRQTLRVVVEDCIGQMKQTFHDVIAERCRAGADKSKMAAIETSDNLAASVPWQTYRAVLRHDGEHRGDLNADLVGPMTREMAPSWAQVFDSESDMFAPLMKAARSELSKLLQQIQTSAPPGLKDRCEDQCLIAFNEAHVTTNAILNNIKDYLTNAQKDISRSLTPHIKKELRNAYSEAAAQAGPGSVARQKQMFHDQIDLIRQNVFSDGANALFHQLEQAAEDIGALLHLAFSELSEKVEVVVSVLWDIPADNKAEMIKRRELAKLAQTMLRQSKAWLEAIENSASQLQMDPVTSTSTDKFGPRGAAGDDEDYESDEDSLMTDANTQEQLYARAPVS